MSYAPAIHVALIGLIILPLAIVACCGVATPDTARSVLLGGSWAYMDARVDVSGPITGSIEADDKIYFGFWGACRDDHNGNVNCESWSALETCSDSSTSQSELWQRACRTRDLQHWLGFCVVSAFFVTFFYFLSMMLRASIDSKLRKKASLILGFIALLLNFMAWVTYVDQCKPTGFRLVTVFGQITAPVHSGPGLNCAIAVFVFLLLSIVASIMTPVANARAQAAQSKSPVPTVPATVVTSAASAV